MDDLTDGTLKDWPVSLMIERDAGGKAYAAQLAAYEDQDRGVAPDDIVRLCSDITDALDGLTPTAALRKAKSMGFVPDGLDQ